MTLEKFTIDHPTNGYYSTRYLYCAVNTKTQQTVLIYSTPKNTVRELWDAANDAHAFLKDAAGLAELTASVIGKGKIAYLQIDDTDWVIKRIGTKREFHGRTFDFIPRS